MQQPKIILTNNLISAIFVIVLVNPLNYIHLNPRLILSLFLFYWLQSFKYLTANGYSLKLAMRKFRLKNIKWDDQSPDNFNFENLESINQLNINHNIF